jgi:hypothetical protein
MPKEVKLTVLRIVGATSIYFQSGSLRMILPRRVSKILGVQKPERDLEEENKTVILVETTKGILLRPLQDFLADEEFKGL